MKPFSQLIKPNQGCSSSTHLINPSAGIPDPKKVLLYDWWLLKPHGKGIAVGGFASRGEQVRRVFHSSTVVKRHDCSTLETSDGFIILLSGFISRSCTQQNGFSSKVCSHFLLGFPYDWEDYIAQWVEEESSDQGNHTKHSGFNEFNRSSGRSGTLLLPDDFSVPGIRDILMSTNGTYDGNALRNHVLNAILGKFDPAHSETPSNSEKFNVEQERKNLQSGLPAADRIREDHQKSVSPFTAVSANSAHVEAPANSKKPMVEQKQKSLDSALPAVDRRTEGKSEKPVSLSTMVVGKQNCKNRVGGSLVAPYRTRAQAHEKPVSSSTLAGIKQKHKIHNSSSAAAGGGREEEVHNPVSPSIMAGDDSVLINSGDLFCGLQLTDRSRQLQKHVCKSSMSKSKNATSKDEFVLSLKASTEFDHGADLDYSGEKRPKITTTGHLPNGSVCRRSSRLKNSAKICYNESPEH